MRIAKLSLLAVLTFLAGAISPTVIQARKPTPQLTLADLTGRAIQATNPKLSTARKNTLAKMLTGIATEVFADTAHREYWIALLAVESGFDGSLKSPVGATGLGQLMPQYAPEFAKQCGLGSLTVADLADDYTNAYVSACEFRRLLRDTNGNIPLALASYNAGQHSYSVKQIKQGKAPVQETAGYVTKVMFKKAQTAIAAEKQND